MAGAAKNRANRERQHQATGNGSSSGETSSSGKATRSARSDRSQGGRSTTSRRTAFDGNRDEGSRPGSPRPSGSRPSSPRPGSPSSGQRDPNTSKPAVTEIRNMDLPAAAYSVVRGQQDRKLAPRGPPSKAGQPIKMGLNTFDTEISTSITVYQYDVHIGNGVETRGLIRNVWESKTVKKALGNDIIFDGNKLAWSLKPLNREIRLLVDLDLERNRTVRPGGKTNQHRVMIRQTNTVGLASLFHYMSSGGKVDFNNTHLEAITCLAHVFRQTPASKHTSIKQSIFARTQDRTSLGGGIEAIKGAYQSLRVVHAGAGFGRLSLNIDVANTAFWTESTLVNAAIALTGKRDANDLVQALKQGEKTSAVQALKKMRKLHVVAKPRGGREDRYVIDRFVFKSARDLTFEKDGKTTTIYDYYAREYSIRLQYDLPLVKATKGKNTLVPFELCKLDPYQRYNSKLDERQTTAMLKFAVTTPPKRAADITECALHVLDHEHDPVLNTFGITVSKNMKTVDARLLPAPKVQFGQGTATPGTSGRWDLKAKKFLTPNAVPLKSWAVCVVPGRRGGKPEKAAIENFIREFCRIYQSHGGRIENKQPAMALGQGDDVGAHVTAAWNSAGNQASARPQLLVFILPDKDSTTYGRIKRSTECRYGVVSQCLQYAQVQKAQGQYISNVCLKVNAKLGGSTARAVGQKSGGPNGHFPVPLAILGADVTHGAPGTQTASIASLTCSMDRLGTRYSAAVETNGFRVEMITTENINNMLKPLLQTWTQQVGGGKFPQVIMYFRDGVSEGQYSHVLEQEIADMKRLIQTADPKLDIPFVVLVGGKRHHYRFFPENGGGKGDKNGNCFPGTLVETGITSPFENDFYLCSHSAIKGTARPMHYHVLINETKMTNEELQALIYEQCYQYVRSTTPISQHPAIYYAHLAAERAIPHDPRWSGSSDGTPSAKAPSGSQPGSGGAGSSSGAPAEFEKLMPMPNQGAIMTSMWYV